MGRGRSHWRRRRRGALPLLALALALALAVAVAAPAALATPLPPEDTTPPSVEITSGPKSTTSDSRPAFAFRSDDSTASFACSMDSAPFQPCGPYGYLVETSLPPGPHTFTVQATDPAGNSATASWSFLEILQARITRIGHNPRHNPRNGTALLTVEVNQAGTVTISGPKIETEQRTTTAAGFVRVPIRPGPVVERSLQRFGHATVAVEVLFESPYEQSEWRQRRVHLRLDPESRQAQGSIRPRRIA